MVFWTLYNDLCIGDEYWVYYTRSDLNKLIRQHNPEIKLTNISSVLQTLADRGYIQMRTLQDRTYGTGIQAYELRIDPQAWDRTEPALIYRSRTPEQQKAYNDSRKAKKQMPAE